jgi:hypothetical protein
MVRAGPLDPDDASMRVIHEGVAPGENVIIQGRQRVRPGATVKTKPAGEEASSPG